MHHYVSFVSTLEKATLFVFSRIFCPFHLLFSFWFVLCWARQSEHTAFRPYFQRPAWRQNKGILPDHGRKRNQKRLLFFVFLFLFFFFFFRLFILGCCVAALSEAMRGRIECSSERDRQLKAARRKINRDKENGNPYNAF